MKKTLSAFIAFAFLAGCSSVAQSDRFPKLVQAGKDLVPDQPNMGIALCALKKAHEHLEAATADKGGLRVEAIHTVESAIDEVRRGIAFFRDTKEGMFRPPAQYYAISVASFDGLNKEGAQRNPAQPNMGTAYVALGVALEYLQTAKADKGGHRVQAISLTETAQSEVQRGIEIGRRN